MLVACDTLALVGAVGVYTRLTACSIDTAFINVWTNIQKRQTYRYVGQVPFTP